MEGCAKAEMVWGNYLCGQELLTEGKIRIFFPLPFLRIWGCLISWEAVLFGFFLQAWSVCCVDLDHSRILFRIPKWVVR